MPLQAYNTNANGTKFHNMFSPKILSNRQCYLASQIPNIQTALFPNLSNRFLFVSTTLYFIPEYSNELFTPPATDSNFRLRMGPNMQIKTGTGTGFHTLTGISSNFTDIVSAGSYFAVATEKLYAQAYFTNNGATLSYSGFQMMSVAQDPLFVTDLVNTRYNNHFVAYKGSGNSLLVVARPFNMTTTTSVQGWNKTINNTNYTFQCSASSGDGTTVSGLWATHLAMVDNAASPNDFCIGTCPPNVLIGRGAYTASQLYKFNNVGEGITNANAYDRWYIALGQFNTGGDWMLMEVYYED